MSDLFDFEEKKENIEIKKLLGKGESLLFREEFEEAKNLFTQIIEEDIMNVQAHLGLLRAYSHDYEILSSPEIDKCLKIINKFFPSIPNEKYRDFLDRKKNRTQRELLFVEAQGILNRKKRKQQEMLAPYEKELSVVETELSNFRSFVQSTIAAENQRIESEKQAVEEKKDMQEMDEIHQYLLNCGQITIKEFDLEKRLEYFQKKYPVYGKVDLLYGLYYVDWCFIDSALKHFSKGFYNNKKPEPLCLSYAACCRFYLNDGPGGTSNNYQWAEKAITEIDMAAQNGIYDHYYLGAVIHWRGYNKDRHNNAPLGDKYMEKYYEVYKNDLRKLAPYAVYLYFNKKYDEAINLLKRIDDFCSDPIACFYLGKIYASSALKNPQLSKRYFERSAQRGYKKALAYLDPVVAKSIKGPMNKLLDFEYVISF